MKLLNDSLLLAGLIIMAACKAPKESKPALTSGLLLENMDSTIQPGNNFQMFVNGKWIKNTEIPADKSNYGVGYMVHEQSQDNVNFMKHLTLSQVIHFI